MKFSRTRYLKKTLVPIALLLILSSFGAYNLVVGLTLEWGEQLTSTPAVTAAFQRLHLHTLTLYVYHSLAFLGLVQLGIFLATGLSGARRLLVIKLHYFACIAQLVLLALRYYLAIRIPSVLLELKVIQDAEELHVEHWIPRTYMTLLVLALTLAWGLFLGMREVRNIFAGQFKLSPLWADRILEDLRTHGGKARDRKSCYVSVLAHLLVIVIIPFLMTIRGCVYYDRPEGGGEAKLPQKVKKIKKKKKKKKRIVLNMDSAIIWHRPKIDESEVFEELDKETQNTYVAGQLGHGKGNKPGFVGGRGNAPIRFIRLKYSGGGDWDQDMGKGADYNFLIKFSELTKFSIAKNTEHHDILTLGRYPKNRAPPFVFITGGKRNGMRVSSKEAKAMRKYLIEGGGMLFADAGGSRFDRYFRPMMARVLPQHRFVTISHDDIIYRQPFLFPNGAPPFWHHAGKEAYGIKHEGRWIVFYHPGDINDAWKDGHSGASEAVAEQAYQLGVNVVYYAFVQYSIFNTK